MHAVRAPSSSDLDQTVGYRIETPEGSLGVIDGCSRGVRGNPPSLLVAQGWFGRRKLDVPVDTIIEIDHGKELVLVQPGVAPLERRRLDERLGRLIERGPDPA
jgi:hypothetical protein